MNTAQNLKILDAHSLQLENLSIATWYDELGVCFAYSFNDGSSVINTQRGLIACSTKALKRWCSNGKIDNLLT